MKWIKPIKSRDGYRFDDNEVVRDGQTVRTPLLLCDSIAGRRSGYLQYTDAQNEMRQSARQSMIDRAASAWRTNPFMDARRKPDDDEDGDDDTDDSRDRKRRASDAAIADAREAYHRMCARLQSAWRDAGPEPSLHTPPAAWQRNGPPPGSTPSPYAAEEQEEVVERTKGLERDVEKRRQRQDAKNRQRLQNAWRVR
jgi:hypothetical protein